MPLPTFDFLIAGGGLAGLSLACRLTHSPLAGASIVVVDQQPIPWHGRCWSYWSETPTSFAAAVAHRWSQLHVAGEGYALTTALPAGQFELLRGDDLADFAQALVHEHSGLTFRRGTVAGIRSTPDGAEVVVDGETLSVRWVFDSTGWPASQRSGRHPLSMYFRSWAVTTNLAPFQPETVTFLDTRTPQPGELRFFYVLPFTAQQALVQLVSYGRRPVPPGEARAALDAYLAHAWGLAGYHAADAEAGCLPLVTSAHPRRLGPRHLAIGARAGLVKPSTGYGLPAIERDSAAIVDSLVRLGHPWRLPPVVGRHRLYDALLLDVLARRGAQGAMIFGALFRRNRLGRVLRFLAEATNPGEELALIGTLPPGDFLRALPTLAARRWGAPAPEGAN